MQTAPLTPSPDRKSGVTQPDFDAFIHLIAHDLRGAARALTALPGWIEEDLQAAGIDVEEGVRDTITLMQLHARRMDQMVMDIYAYSRVGREQNAEWIALDPAVAQVWDEISAPDGFVLRREVRDIALHLGARDLTTLLTALLSNTVKHHDKAAGRIEARSFLDHDDVVLRISDDGPGIPAACAGRVFQPMTTLRSRDEVEGSGMGLAVARKIASHYGGSIELASKEAARGTTVDVRFPARLSKCQKF